MNMNQKQPSAMLKLAGERDYIQSRLAGCVIDC
jgi:hypothetical protein